MRICYSIADQTFRHSKSIGILNVSVGLLPALARQLEVEKIVVLGNSSLPSFDDHLGKISRVVCDQPLRGKMSRMWWDQFGLYRAAQKTGCDWIFLPKGFASFLRRPPLKLASYVHDVLRDFCRTNYPATFSRGEYWYFDSGLKGTLRHSSRIFTNSEFTRSEVMRLGRALAITLPPVSLAGIGFSAAAPVPGAKQDQVMALINRWEYKLARQTVDFVARWQRDASYAGLIHWVGDLPADVHLPNLPNAKHSWRVPDEQYFSIMAASRALVYASAYEGFGMPPVEAILRSTPPVYSAIPAMSESAQGFGFSFANRSYESFFAAMNQALLCPASQLRVWAASLLQRHDWEQVAGRIVRGLGGGECA